MIRSSSILSLGLISLLPLITGCTRTPLQVDDNVPPFVFRSLNLRQQDKQGRPAWELTSPEARYDVRRRLARAIDPRGVIYKDGVPAYELEASSGTVINDGEVILMEGRIRLRQLGKNPLLIKATRLRWYPSEELMQIDRKPEALDRQNRIIAEKARFLLDKQQLELRGKPELQRWTKGFDPLKDESRPVPELVIKASRADWQPNTGLLDVRGPLNATRRPAAGSPPDQKPMTLTASALDGNTIQQEFVLKGPVNLLDPAESTTLQASRLRIDVKTNRIRSDQAFSGNRGDLLVRGQVPGGGWSRHHRADSQRLRNRPSGRTSAGPELYLELEDPGGDRPGIDEPAAGSQPADHPRGTVERPSWQGWAAGDHGPRRTGVQPVQGPPGFGSGETAAAAPKTGAHSSVSRRAQPSIQSRSAAAETARRPPSQQQQPFLPQGLDHHSRQSGKKGSNSPRPG